MTTGRYRKFQASQGQLSPTVCAPITGNIPEVHVVGVGMEHHGSIRVLGISGSLRRSSSNRALLAAMASLVRANQHLLETLTVMSARVIADASITVVLPGRVVDADGIAAADELATRLRGAPVLVAPDLPGALARERLLLSP